MTNIISLGGFRSLCGCFKIMEMLIGAVLGVFVALVIFSYLKKIGYL